MMVYEILRSDSIFELETKVNEYLKRGWNLAGGVSYNSNKKCVMQAVFK